MKGTLGLAIALVPLLLSGGCLAGVLLLDSANCPPGGSPQADPSQYAHESIPEDYLRIYQEAAADRGVPWNVLAAVGHVESHHGRWDGPGITEGHNTAGAAGPMQFGAVEGSAAGNTWGGDPVMPVEERPEIGYGIDGNGDGVVDVYDPADAIPAAADYLLDHGAPEDLNSALFAYNHAGWYVEEVLDVAERYAEGDYTTVAVSSECTGPVGVGGSADAQAVVDWALQQVGKPYIWGGIGPDGFDCSGLTQQAYAHIGVEIPRVTHDQVTFGARVSENEAQPGDLIFIDTPAAGANQGPRPRHVGMVVDPSQTLMVEAPRTGLDIRTSSWEGRPIYAITRPLAA